MAVDPQRQSIPEFMEIIKEMVSTHELKNFDYASSEDGFSNFHRAADIVRGFSQPIDQVFAGIIGIKLARLMELLGTSKIPNNESIEDNFKDFCNYAVLWAAWHKKFDQV